MGPQSISRMCWRCAWALTAGAKSSPFRMRAHGQVRWLFIYGVRPHRARWRWRVAILLHRHFSVVGYWPHRALHHASKCGTFWEMQKEIQTRTPQCERSLCGQAFVHTHQHGAENLLNPVLECSEDKRKGKTWSGSVGIQQLLKQEAPGHPPFKYFIQNPNQKTSATDVNTPNSYASLFKLLKTPERGKWSLAPRDRVCLHRARWFHQRSCFRCDAGGCVMMQGLTRHRFLRQWKRNPLRWWNIFCWRAQCKQSLRFSFRVKTDIAKTNVCACIFARSVCLWKDSFCKAPLSADSNAILKGPGPFSN